jgi:hypothetical protein
VFRNLTADDPAFNSSGGAYAISCDIKAVQKDSMARLIAGNCYRFGFRF